MTTSVDKAARAIWNEVGASNTGWTFEQDREDMETIAKAALEASGLIAENERLAYAVWMVGNIDTAEDKAAWWAEFEPLWQQSARIVAACAKRGVPCGQGFAAFDAALQPNTGEQA